MYLYVYGLGGLWLGNLTLKSRRSMSTLFILGLIRDVDSESMKFNVPMRPTRNFKLLSIKYYRSEYADNDFVNRACKTFNECYEVVDFSKSKDLLKDTQTIFINC